MCAKPISAAEAGTWVPACRIEALAGRTLVPVRVAGRHLLLVQDGGVLFATERACPHEGADLALGHCARGRLFCPRHQAWFTLQDGTVSPGWDFRRLRTFATRCVGTRVDVLMDGLGPPLGEGPS